MTPIPSAALDVIDAAITDARTLGCDPTNMIGQYLLGSGYRITADLGETVPEIGPEAVPETVPETGYDGLYTCGRPDCTLGCQPTWSVR